MKTFHHIPAVIRVTDLVGITTSESDKFRKRAEAELKVLFSQMAHKQLEYGTRRVELASNVICECRITHELKYAEVIVGARAEEIVNYKTCWCCGPCLVGGLIVDLKALKDGEETNYLDDTTFVADIVICQKSSLEDPYLKETSIIRAAEGAISKKTRRDMTNSYSISDVLKDIPFSDKKHHTIGSSVLVLVMPLVDFDIKEGNISPCVNRRYIASGENTALTISNIYTNSTGMSCKILQDRVIWEGSEKLQIPAQPNYTPFRILPINILSCLTGLS